VHVLRGRDGELWERARFFPLEGGPETIRTTPRRESRSRGRSL